MIFTEVEEGGLKASMRSNENINVSTLAGKLFSGGGHARAAGFRLNNYENFQIVTIECVQKIIREMKVQRGEIKAETSEEKGKDTIEAKKSNEKKRSDDGTIDIMQTLSE